MSKHAGIKVPIHFYIRDDQFEEATQRKQDIDINQKEVLRWQRFHAIILFL